MRLRCDFMGRSACRKLALRLAHYYHLTTSLLPCRRQLLTPTGGTGCPAAATAAVRCRCRAVWLCAARSICPSNWSSWEEASRPPAACHSCLLLPPMRLLQPRRLLQPTLCLDPSASAAGRGMLLLPGDCELLPPPAAALLLPEVAAAVAWWAPRAGRSCWGPLRARGARGARRQAAARMWTMMSSTQLVVAAEEVAVAVSVPVAEVVAVAELLVAALPEAVAAPLRQSAALLISLGTRRWS